MSNSSSAHSIPHYLQVPTESFHMSILVFLLFNVIFHRPPLPRAQSLLLCKGKAPAGSTQARGGEAERGSRALCRAWGRTWAWCPHSMGYLHHLHVLLLQLCQARQHFQSLSWAATKEKETLRAKSAMHFPLQFAVQMESLVRVCIGIPRQKTATFSKKY